MAFISVGQLARSLNKLQPFHAFYGVTFLSMKKTGVGVGTATGWGGTQEEALLRQYFAPAGAPPDKPYCVPFGRKDPDSWYWKNSKYSGGTLQRARTTDNYREALERPTNREWEFTADYLDKLEGLLPDGSGGLKLRIPVFDLAAWLHRHEDLPSSLDDVETKFRTEFNINDEEYARLFDVSRPPVAQYFSPVAITEEELASKDVHGRLFLCLKSSKYGAFSAIELHSTSRRSILKCIPRRIPFVVLVIFFVVSFSFFESRRMSIQTIA